MVSEARRQTLILSMIIRAKLASTLWSFPGCFISFLKEFKFEAVFMSSGRLFESISALGVKTPEIIGCLIDSRHKKV